ncbi:hypothetical protein Lesp02_84230 [Lentzea sp. NBRC 105346]|uniref:HNH endonuclease n=1 Tax=Lentzea sp. NBRC 105346 TaxID=3032205 RepID=UPI00249FFCD9|nr:HNH endonuclease [Lentzea sp. NBRC 105346]GLZ36236.1 hypothetical protein Lesp02_84230 [Lentzea sp. NBRC 105346]
MPWFKGDDKAYGNPKLRAVAAASRGAMTGVTFCWLYAAQQRTNGWLPQWVVDNEFRPAELVAVTTIKANGRAPLLHQYNPDTPPDELCDCLTGLRWTPEMGGYWIHDWLDHNPSKAENTVHRAKRRELGDKDLIHLVKMRDGNACRYCLIVVPWADKKSANALCIDHVDPTVARGADNLVVACTSCNARKKDARTPEAAGLTLHGPPVPGTVPADGWPKGTDPLSIQRVTPWPPEIEIADQIASESPDPIADRSPIGSGSDHRSELDQTVDPHPRDRSVENQTDQAQHTTRASPDATTDGLPLERGGDGSGSRTSPGPHPTQTGGDVGPRGRRTQVGPATTPRTAASPPTYRKTATSNPPDPEERRSP